MARSKPDYLQDSVAYLALLKQMSQWSAWKEGQFHVLQKTYPKADGGVVSKTELLAALNNYAEELKLSEIEIKKLKPWLLMKPTRTISGVAPVTVLTKPFPCPGKCIFCPNDVRMPKSYLSDEPGAQRAEKNYFDPYLQCYSRLKALSDMGHAIDKIELIILGGTWSFYPEAYQLWFIAECFRAMNEFGKADGRIERRARYEAAVTLLKTKSSHVMTDNPLENAAAMEDKKITGADTTYNQVISELYVAPEKKLGLDVWQTATWAEIDALHLTNETAEARCVGLVIETRPDHISEAEVMKIRRLGCTKTQIGVQSLQDAVLEKNHRGHDVAATRRAFNLLRQAGFKIHAHWMPNLYGSSPAADAADYHVLFEDLDFKPDELKIYPCSLIESAELMRYYQQGLWKPYTEPELLRVLTECFKVTPPYCRLTRVIRDIPSTDIVVGNKKTNFRQVVQDYLAENHIITQDIRAREIRGREYDPATIEFDIERYETTVSQELFLQFTAMPSPERKTKNSPAPTEPQRKLLAFLRLSLPKESGFIAELDASAIIREIHVYGQVSKIGESGGTKAQHVGFGTQLIGKAQEIAQKANYKNLAVISAIGTREYYRSRGFSDGSLYQHMSLV
jgi:elongator complex protein 3